MIFKKQQVIKLMRTKGITANEAAEQLGVPKTHLIGWLARDKDFIRAWEALSCVRAIDHILAADDLARSGKTLTPGEAIYVENARRLIQDLTALGLLDAVPQTERRLARAHSKRQLSV